MVILERGGSSASRVILSVHEAASQASRPAPWPRQVRDATVCDLLCRSGGIGRRAGLKIPFDSNRVGVQVPPPAPHSNELRDHFASASVPGRLLAREDLVAQTAGTRERAFGARLPAGMFFLRLRQAGREASGKLIVVH